MPCKSSLRILSWTCLNCSTAGDVAIQGDVRASSMYIRRLHDGLSGQCKDPEIVVVDDGNAVKLTYYELRAGAASDTKITPAYPD